MQTPAEAEHEKKGEKGDVSDVAKHDDAPAIACEAGDDDKEDTSFIQSHGARHGVGRRILLPPPNRTMCETEIAKDNAGVGVAAAAGAEEEGLTTVARTKAEGGGVDNDPLGHNKLAAVIASVDLSLSGIDVPLHLRTSAEMANFIERIMEIHTEIDLQKKKLVWQRMLTACMQLIAAVRSAGNDLTKHTSAVLSAVAREEVKKRAAEDKARLERYRADSKVRQAELMQAPAKDASRSCELFKIDLAEFNVARVVSGSGTLDPRLPFVITGKVVSEAARRTDEQTFMFRTCIFD